MDPDAPNWRAFDHQEVRIERLGGLEAILAGPNFHFTPCPWPDRTASDGPQTTQPRLPAQIHVLRVLRTPKAGDRPSHWLQPSSYS